MCKSKVNCKRPSDIIKEFYYDLLFISKKCHHPVSTRTLHGQKYNFVKRESILHCPVERQSIVEIIWTLMG